MQFRTTARTIAIAMVCAVSVISAGRHAMDAHTDKAVPMVAETVHDIPGEQVSLFSAPLR